MIRHFHFLSWPDMGVPESNSLMSFQKLIRKGIKDGGEGEREESGCDLNGAVENASGSGSMIVADGGSDKVENIGNDLEIIEKKCDVIDLDKNSAIKNDQINKSDEKTGELIKLSDDNKNTDAMDNKNEKGKLDDKSNKSENSNQIVSNESKKEDENNDENMAIKKEPAVKPIIIHCRYHI